MPTCSLRPTIIFDFDGTLANSLDPALDYLFTTILPAQHIHILAQDLARWRNKSIWQVARALPFSFWKIPRIMLEVKKWHDANLNLVNLYPAVPTMVKELAKQNFRLMIVTSNSVSNVQAVLARSQLNDYFETIKESHGIFNKPQALKELLRQHQLVAAEVIYVGDEIRDICACRKVGIPIIAVTYGLNGEKGLKKNKPQYLAASPQEVVSIAQNSCLLQSYLSRTAANSK